MKKINNVHITFFRIGNKYNLPQYVKLDMTGNKMKYYYNYCISDLTDDEEKIITEYIERNFNKENGFFEFDKEQSVRIPLNDVEKNYEDMNMPCLYVIVEYDDGSKLLQASGNLFFEDVPNVIDCFLKSIKIIMNNHKYDEINLEKSMIEIAIYLRMSRASEEQNLYLNECIYFLRDEIWASQDGHPIYQIDRGNPINKLSSYFIGINNEQYKQIIESVIQKIGYYSKITAGMPLMELSSEKMVENLAYEIIYVNKGTEELKKEVNVNLFAKYVLAVRYECSEMYEKAYKLYEELAEKGFIKGIIKKATCLFYGRGTEKSCKNAYELLKSAVQQSTYSSAILLLGKMYYTGQGTEINYDKAFELFSEIGNWNLEAKYYLAYMHLQGYGTVKNEEKGIRLMKETASEGYSKAINYLQINNKN